MRGGFVLFAAAIVAIAAAGRDVYATTRFALVVGVNHGRADDPALQFAEDDAERIAGVLVSVGGFQPENVILLKNAYAVDLHRALNAALKRVENAAEESMLFVYYSGHADGEALNMNGSRFELETLREKIVSAVARTRVLVLDACHSGVLTRVKGGTASPEFSLDLGIDRVEAEGFAIVASSAAGEQAQESDELGASFFTHYFVSALVGAGDADGDRRVTLAEAFAYASDRTLRATTPTAAGPQHPTYKVELKGRDDLVLTDLSRDSLRRVGVLELSGPGRFLITAAEGALRAIAELELGEGETKPLALDVGRYSVTQRQGEYLLIGDAEIAAGVSTRISEGEMRRVEFARVVRKGGTNLRSVMSAFVIGGVRSPLLDLGVSWQSVAGARWDARSFAMELRIGVALSARQNDRLDITTRELSLSAVGLYAFDLGAVTANLGVELGAVQAQQQYGAPAFSHVTYNVLAGPLALFEIPLGRVYLRAEAAAPVYVARKRATDVDSDVTVAITARATLGLGFYF